jgi:hypothetical protein
LNPQQQPKINLKSTTSTSTRDVKQPTLQNPPKLHPEQNILPTAISQPTMKNVQNSLLVITKVLVVVVVLALTIKYTVKKHVLVLPYLPPNLQNLIVGLSATMEGMFL